MSIDEAHLTEGLSRYAEGVVMTASDTDRMLDELHRRLGPAHHGRWRLVAAVAAALLLVAAVAGAAWWLRKPPDPIPVKPPPQGSLTGLWKFTNPLTSSLFVIRADNSVSEYPNAQALVQQVTQGGVRVTYDSEHLQVDSNNAVGQSCRGRWAITSPEDGRVEQGPQVYEGPGCDSTSGPASTLTRLSPDSEAARQLPATTEGPVASSLTDPVQLDGVWLVKDTGVVVAMDERSGPATFVLDSHAYVDAAPQAHGAVSVGSDGTIGLTDPRCGQLRLQDTELRGQTADLTLTARVAADPCGWFEGRLTVTWVRVL